MFQKNIWQGLIITLAFTTIVFAQSSKQSSNNFNQQTVALRFSEISTGVFDAGQKPIYVVGRFGKFLVIQETGSEVLVTELKTQLPVIQSYGITPDGKIIVYETDEPSYRTVAENLETGDILTIGEKFGADVTSVSPVRNEAVSLTIYDDNGETRNGLLYINFDTGEERLLADRDVSGKLTWSTDGRKVFYYQKNIVKRAAINSLNSVNASEVETEYLTPMSISIADGYPNKIKTGKNLPPTFSRLNRIYSAEELISKPALASENEEGVNAYAPTEGSTVYSPNNKIKIVHNGEQELNNVQIIDVKTGASKNLPEAAKGQLLSVINNGIIVWKDYTDSVALEFIGWNNKATVLVANAASASAVSYGLPIKNSTVSQVGNGYSPSCEVASHTGSLAYAIDFKGSSLAHILASAKGKVVAASNTVTCSRMQTCGLNYDPYRVGCGGSDWGNYIIIRHDDGKRTLYAHLTSNSLKVSLNAEVCQGQYIADQGHTGYIISSNTSTCGNHLHHQLMAENTGSPSAINTSVKINYDDAVNPLKCNKAYTSALTEITGCSVVGSYSLVASPITTTIRRGDTTSFYVQAYTNNGFRGTVNFYAINLPGNQVLSGTGFTPGSVNIQANGTYYGSNLVIKTNSSTPRGTFTIKIEGRSGNKIISTNVQLIIR